MQELEGDSMKEMVRKKWFALLEWLKPKPGDSGLIVGLKMIYKAIAVLALLAISPILMVVLLFIFFAAF